MKTCSKCGRNFSDATPRCPNCRSAYFYTDNGIEYPEPVLIPLVSLIIKFMKWLYTKNSVLFWIALILLVIWIISLVIKCSYLI